MGSPYFVRVCACVLCIPFQIQYLLTSFHEIWYENYAVGGNPNLVLFNILKSVTVPNFMKIGQYIQYLKGEIQYTHKEWWSHKLAFFLKKECKQTKSLRRGLRISSLTFRKGEYTQGVWCPHIPFSLRKESRRKRLKKGIWNSSSELRERSEVSGYPRCTHAARSTSMASSRVKVVVKLLLHLQTKGSFCVKYIMLILYIPSELEGMMYVCLYPTD